MNTTTSTLTPSCAAEARSSVQPPEMSVKEWGYFRAAIGWRCQAEVQQAKRQDSDRRLKEAERTIELAKAIVQAPPPPAEGWSDLEMGVGIGLALVLGAAAAAVSAWAVTR